MNIPLKVGSSGVEVLELKEKLAKSGFLDSSDIKEGKNEFDENLKRAVKSLQAARNLDVDGICGPDTWAALKEAEWQLGSRHLYTASPMLRGDDVGDLQKLLGQLGFNAGREDGIFGPDTANALAEFQKNNHLAVDRICGADTVKALRQISLRAKGENVASVKDRERYRTHFLDSEKTSVNVFIAGIFSMSKQDSGELEALNLLGEKLSSCFQKIKTVSFQTNINSNPSDLAAEANAFKADVCLGFKFSPDALFQTSYFATGTYESAGGKRLAEIITQQMSESKLLFQHEAKNISDSKGMRTALLKETKMWTVMNIFGPQELLKTEIDKFSEIYIRSFKLWVSSPNF